MEPINNKLLLLIGSGPGIGVAVAARFSRQLFNRIALVARNPVQLAKDKEAVLCAASHANRSVVVRTWQADIGDTAQLTQALCEIEQFGRLECVFFNAARVGPSALFDFPVDGIEKDFQVTNVAMYLTARWAIPLLVQNAKSHPLGLTPDWSPSFLVTSSLLPLQPYPELFALSMVKAAQANLVKSIEKTFSPQGVHVGLVVVGGMVSPNAAALNPTNIAEQAWKFFCQARNEWTTQVTIYETGAVSWDEVI